MSEATLALRDVTRSFRQGSRRIDVLRGIHLSLQPGERVGLIGPSGAGKSTLLHIAGLLERPDGGAVVLAGQDCGSLSDRARTLLRRSDVGFVYQFHHLLPELSALENVMLPQRIAGVGKAPAREQARALLCGLGLEERLSHAPAALSGGEQQRVAIARALANRPKLLLADEPTGNLDAETSELVFEQLLALAREEGVAMLVATHDSLLAARMDRIVSLQQGLLARVETAAG